MKRPVCNCASDAVESAKNDCYPDSESISLQVNWIDGCTYSDLYIQNSGKKKKTTIALMHNYCPFCGKEYLEADHGQG